MTAKQLKADVLSPDEQAMMERTFKATMKRAADIIEAITQNDLLDAQAAMLASGVSLERVARMDRLDLAVAHLRACISTTTTPEARGRG